MICLKKKKNIAQRRFKVLPIMRAFSLSQILTWFLSERDKDRVAPGKWELCPQPHLHLSFLEIAATEVLWTGLQIHGMLWCFENTFGIIKIWVCLWDVSIQVNFLHIWEDKKRTTGVEDGAVSREANLQTCRETNACSYKPLKFWGCLLCSIVIVIAN